MISAAGPPPAHFDQDQKAPVTSQVNPKQALYQQDTNRGNKDHKNEISELFIEREMTTLPPNIHLEAAIGVSTSPSDQDQQGLTTNRTTPL